MGALKYCAGMATDNFTDAVNILYNINRVILYNRREDKLRELVIDLVKEIKERNKLIDNLDNQMIAVYPYYFMDIKECLPVYCAELGIGKVSDSIGTISLTGFDKSVLNKTGE